jgi:outer membrane protein OmpA-like peptidoglycan-associated protein
MMSRVKRLISRGGIVAALLVVAATGARAQPVRLPPPTVTYTAGEKAKVSGLIIRRDSDEILVRDETHTSRVSRVTFTTDTKISSPSGFLNLGHTPQEPSTLIPGLIIDVTGTGGSRGNLMAQSISFRERDLRVARQIAAGDVEIRARERQTAAIVAATRDTLANAKERARDSLDAVNTRISRLDVFDLRVRGTVYFAPNSATLTKEGEAILDDLVAKSQRFEGYVIEVTGYTDDVGTAAAQDEISTRRADVVTEYLIVTHSVPLRRIVGPTGFGALRPVATNSTEQGRAENRRVELRLLVSRGLQGTTTTIPSP